MAEPITFSLELKSVNFWKGNIYDAIVESLIVIATLSVNGQVSLSLLTWTHKVYIFW